MQDRCSQILSGLFLLISKVEIRVAGLFLLIRKVESTLVGKMLEISSFRKNKLKGNRGKEEQQFFKARGIEHNIPDHVQADV